MHLGRLSDFCAGQQIADTDAEGLAGIVIEVSTLCLDEAAVVHKLGQVAQWQEGMDSLALLYFSCQAGG